MQKIRNAIMVYLNAIEVNHKFYGITLIDYVRERTNERNIYDDTILRNLRLLREKGKINYSIKDKAKSEYYLTKIQ